MATKSCPHCDRTMTSIRLIDKTNSPRVRDATLEYAAGDAEPGFWLGRFSVEGQIEGLMCDKCGRVLLYAKPKD